MFTSCADCLFLPLIVQNCLRTKLGYDYAGPADTTIHGDKCVTVGDSKDAYATWFRRWYHRIPAPFGQNDIGRYCRNVPGMWWSEPRCYVVDQGSTRYKLHYKPCSIPYCGKLIQVYMYKDLINALINTHL